MKTDKIGARDRYILIYTKTVSPNGFGENIETWNQTGQAFASLSFNENISDEDTNQSVVINSTLAFFTIPAQVALTQENRINYNGQFYDVLAIVEDDRNHLKTAKAVHTISNI